MIKNLVSIIVVCHNEVQFIAQCLESIFNFQPSVGSQEVIVVDGMSNDGTREILTKWQQKFPALKVIDNPQQITPKAMNLGIKASKGEYIIFLSTHVLYSAQLLVQTLAAFESVKADNIGGVIITLPRGVSFEARLVQAVTTHRFGIGNSDFRVGSKEGYVDTVAYGCYKRTVFDRIGLHDERLVRNQDYEINQRLINAGGRIWQNPKIKSSYYNQATISGLLFQAWSNGKWNPWMWFVAPYSFAPRHAIPGVFLFSLLFSFILVSLIPIFWPVLAVILGPYFILAIISAIQQAQRYQNWWMLACLPFLFFAYHISYGAGILWGIIALVLQRSPVQHIPEPWPGAGQYRAWPPEKNHPSP